MIEWERRGQRQRRCLFGSRWVGGERPSRKQGRAGARARECYSRNIYDRARSKERAFAVTGGELKTYKNVYTPYFRPLQRDTSQDRCVNSLCVIMFKKCVTIIILFPNCNNNTRHAMYTPKTQILKHVFTCLMLYNVYFCSYIQQVTGFTYYLSVSRYINTTHIQSTGHCKN